MARRRNRTRQERQAAKNARRRPRLFENPNDQGRDLALTQRAVSGRWPITEPLRQLICDRIEHWLRDDPAHPDARKLQLHAARTLITAEGQNQRDEISADAHARALSALRAREEMRREMAAADSGSIHIHGDALISAPSKDQRVTRLLEQVDRLLGDDKA